MKFKKLMLVAFVLLAVITIGAVSAADNASSVEDFSSGDMLAVDESSEDLAENPSDEIIASDDDLSSDADEILASSESLSENVTVEVRDKVDASEDNGYIAYVRDDNSLNGTVTLSIDGTQYYNKEFDATKSSVFIRDSDLKDFNFGDFLGNHTVKLTYNNLSKESVVSFVFEPYFIQPYTVAAGEVSYIIFKAPGDFKGEVALYSTAYNNVTDYYDPDELLVRYLISASASEIPLPKLSAGGHVFYVNYTIDGKNNTELFGVYYTENSQNFTSDISSDEINVGDSVTVTVTGPKEGWIDLYVNGKHKALYSLANNTTVKHVFSDLGVGTHVISISYDGQGYNELFYQKEFLITVSNPSAQPGIVDNSKDSSTTSIYGELILRDTATGEVFKRNITVGPIKSSMTKFNNTDVDGNITEIINQLLNLAQIQAGGKTVTVKSQNVTKSALERYDNRTYTPIDLSLGASLVIGGYYGTSWLANVTVIAEYGGGSSCIVSFNATGGEGEMANVVVENNTNFTLPECGFTKENRVFYGWSVGDAIKQPGENITVIGDIAIGTVWRYYAEIPPSSGGKATVHDASVDASITYIECTLILTDARTGEIFIKNITADPVQSSYVAGFNNLTDDMINVTVNQLLGIAQTHAGDKMVLVKNQTVSNDTRRSPFDNRNYVWLDYYEYAEGVDLGLNSFRFLSVGGNYGAIWNCSVLIEAEYASGSSCMVSFDTTGGEGKMANVVVENNTNFTLPECGFTKEYRVFYGWNVGDSIKQPGENITVIGDISIKTVWRSDSEFNNTTGKAEVKDIAVDLSTTSIDGRLLLTDLSTGAVYLINITVGPVKSNYTNPGNDAVIGDMINDAVSQLLNLAQLQTGGKTVTVKNQTVSNVTSTELNDTRVRALHDYYEGTDGLIESPRFLFVSGDYGTAWTYPVLVEAEYTGVVVVNIAEVNVKLSKAAFTYNGKVQKPVITLTDGVVLKEGVDYTLKWSSTSPKKAGTYSVTVTGIGAYNGTVKKTFKINKAANPLKVKAKTVKVKFSKLKKKAQTLAVSKVVKFTKKGQGTLTYVKASGNKKITINKKTGKVAVAKGLKKGTYAVKVKIKAAGNANYKASAYKTLTFKIKIS